MCRQSSSQSRSATNRMLIRIRREGLGLLLAFTAMAALASPAAPAGTPALPMHSIAPAQTTAIDFNGQSVSAQTQRAARWVTTSGDNAGLPYVLIDKVNAEVFVFDATGRLEGSAPALLGLSRGDRFAKATLGEKVGAVQPADRITPAGRFVASLSRDAHGKEVLVVDYAESIALHAVVKGTPAERRAQRLASPTAQDNRISYGCINVPTKFYTSIVSPAFRHSNGIVYILPEMGTGRDLFGTDALDTNLPATTRMSADETSRTSSSVNP